MKLLVITQDSRFIELRNLKPRRYMCGWNFERILKYAKEELYWKDIDEKEVIGFEIKNEKEFWQQPIMRKESE